MSARLPDISERAFFDGLMAVSPEPLPASAMTALYVHYLELARWNERLALVGPGTVDDVLVRHYGESLAALPFIPPAARGAVDLGSGAGFPGLVIAAARPALRMTLVEARERKWSFLVSAARKAALPCQCLNVRVAAPLPAGLPDSIDVVTVRALKLEPAILDALARRLAPRGRILVWAGRETPALPPTLVPGSSHPLSGGERRRIVEALPAAGIGTAGGAAGPPLSTPAAPGETPG